MTQFQAHQIWNEMPVADRAKLMEAVPYVRSVTKRFRAIIALIQKGAA